MPYTCDNASVGVLIFDGEGRLLMLHRAHPPIGIAPVAGHVFDEHEGYMEAAQAEVEEEVGLTVTSLELLGVGGWRPNKCGATDPGSDSRGVGHQWQIFRAEVTGEPHATDEAKSIAMVGAARLQALAERTALYARREITQEQFGKQPGLEPVWCDFLSRLDMIDVPSTDLSLIGYVAATGKQPPAFVIAEAVTGS